LQCCSKYDGATALYFKILRFSVVGMFLFLNLNTFSQCANNNLFWTALNPTGPGNTQSTNCIWGGEYVTVNVCQGASYTFATCGSGWDTFITVYPSIGGGALGWNDDGCGLQSTVTWTATFTGTVWVLVDYWTCTNYASCATLSVTQNTACNGGPPPGDCIYSLVAGGGIYDGEISWSVVNNLGVTVSSGFANYPGGITLCLEEGCFTLNLFDSFGDGWNGANITIFNDQGDLLFNGTMASGSFISYNFCTEPPPPPPAPCYFADPTGCPSIECEADIVIPMCFDPCGPLQVECEVFETGATTSYDVCAIDYNPPYSFNAGIGFSIGVDDVWTNLIPLPFNFCFFGNVYNQVVVGSNGLISFNPGYAAGFCPWAFAATCPSAALPINSIFGIYHDIDPSICGDARYAILGSYPCRAFVVNYDNICHFFPSCNNLISTHQIVLYETTNVIEVHIQSKPTCYSWNSGNALVGVQNAAGTTGFVAPGRQTGPWTASNESWRFTPDGAPNFTVDWYEAGVYLGSGLTVDVCPSEPSHTYEAVATYTNCNGSEVVVEDEVTVVCQSVMLPIELVDFQVKNRSRFVDLTWQTQSEWNNEKFELERSDDIVHWKKIGEEPGAGFSQTEIQYLWIDQQPLNGVSYYRLKQLDFDGNFSYSEVRAVERSDPFSGPFVIPNPNAGSFQIRIQEKPDQIKILDATGREIPFEMPLPSMIIMSRASAGTYIIEAKDLNGQIMFRERFIIE